MQTAQFELHAKVEDRHWWFVARRQILRRVIGQFLAPSSETTIIDVGCGTGGNVAALAGDYRCLGIDASAEAIELARQRFPQLEFVHGFAPADIGDEFQRASLVILNDVLEHVEDDRGLLAELVGALAPGAHVLLTVPADPALWSPHDVAFGHFRRYRQPQFERVWEGLPVDVQFVSAFNARLYPIVRAVRTWNRWRGETSGASGTDFNTPPAPVNRALERLFAGEGRRLAALAAGKTVRPYRHGVSLMALLRRADATLSSPPALADGGSQQDSSAIAPAVTPQIAWPTGENAETTL